MTRKTKNLTTTAILAGLIALLGMTPLGLIPLGFINLTIIHIPVIVGAMTTNKKSSLTLGATFGLCSTLAAFGLSLAAQSGLAAALLGYSPIAVIVMCMVPRMAIPMVTRGTYDALCRFLSVNKARPDKKHHAIAITVASVAGSLTNTVLYLGLMGMFFRMYGIWGQFAAIFSVTLFVGAICEAIAAALIARAVVPAVTKSRKTEYELPETDDADSDDNTPDAFNSSVDEFNVAVIPATDSLLPVLNETMQRRHDRCMKYLDDDNMMMAVNAFDAFFNMFSNDGEAWNLKAYAIMRFIERSKYATASQSLIDFMRSDIMARMLNSDNKNIILGIMNIIHTAVVSDAQNPVFAKVADKIFTESTDLLNAEKLTEAADKFSEYIAEIGAKDRQITRVEEAVYDYPEFTEPTVKLRDLSECDDMEEGISTSNVAVVPTSSGIGFEANEIPARALNLLRIGADAEDAFESFISDMPQHRRADADCYVILTYFEHGDYVKALRAVIRCLNRGYDAETLKQDRVRAAIEGTLTIMHTSLRLTVPENTANADRIMEKARAFFDGAAFALSAQMLEKYFLVTGLAK
ncbi:MAG: ECF transporter S component [Clostridia bacterium]|nr:ECF transporter S component [Clostridia bacterium]